MESKTKTDVSTNSAQQVQGAAAFPTKSQQLDCTHYERRCLLKAKCCGHFFPCRFCHDEDKDHEMNRHLVEQIQCVECKEIQNVSQKCSSCNAMFGEYFCSICRLFDVNKDQFHCDKCGICRIGPRDKYYHCDKCNACLSKELEGNHKCLDNISMTLCPICKELLHTSRQGMHIPRCGHMIHQDCLTMYFKQGLYQCPLCKESLEDMSEVWKEMDKHCAETQLPEELRELKLEILCQDCHQESSQFFNTEGMKCVDCGSYNTVRV